MRTLALYWGDGDQRDKKRTGNRTADIQRMQPMLTFLHFSTTEKELLTTWRSGAKALDPKPGEVDSAVWSVSVCPHVSDPHFFGVRKMIKPGRFFNERALAILQHLHGTLQGRSNHHRCPSKSVSSTFPNSAIHMLQWGYPFPFLGFVETQHFRYPRPKKEQKTKVPSRSRHSHGPGSKTKSYPQ